MIYIIGIQRRSVNRFLLSFPYSVIAGQDTDHHDDTKAPTSSTGPTRFPMTTTEKK